MGERDRLRFELMLRPRFEEVVYNVGNTDEPSRMKLDL